VTPADLKAARENLGLSQASLAQRLGIAWRTYSNYERGVARIPGPVRLAMRALEIDPFL
jgi:DNA-binding transcriptional regulator YiaG